MFTNFYKRDTNCFNEEDCFNLKPVTSACVFDNLSAHGCSVLNRIPITTQRLTIRMNCV